MKKLLHTTLLTTILSTGIMAGELPQTIESGATIYVNRDIYVLMVKMRPSLLITMEI